MVDRPSTRSQAKRLRRWELTLSWIGRPWVLRGSHRGRRTPVAIVKGGIRDLSRRCKAVDGAERDNSGLKRIRRLRVQSRNLREMMDVPHSSAVRPHREIPSQIPALIVGSRWIARLPSSVTYWLPRRLALDTEWPPVYGAFLSDINYVVSCSTARHILNGSRHLRDINIMRDN